MEIPWQQLSEDTLNAVLEEYASREGTEYGAQEYSLQDKVAQLRMQLYQNRIWLDFDPETGSCDLRVRE